MNQIRRRSLGWGFRLMLNNDLHARLKVRVREWQRRTIRFLGGLSNRDFEYDFAYRNVVGESLHILDIGSRESLLPLQWAKCGFKVTAYDYRPYQERHPNLEVIAGDFLQNTLPDASFDFVVLVSTIEHIGFGSYGTPTCEDGDFLTLAEVKRVLKPLGKVILTFPFASREQQIDGFERWYDTSRVSRLFQGLHVLGEEYYIPQTFLLGRIVKWIPASREQITSTDDVIAKFGYQCQACYLVSPSPREAL